MLIMIDGIDGSGKSTVVSGGIEQFVKFLEGEIGAGGDISRGAQCKGLDSDFGLARGRLSW